MSSVPTATLVEQGVLALRAGDRPRAFDLLVQALRQDPRSELGWLWLSGAVIGKAEQRYCLERVLEINPGNAGVRKALEGFPPDLPAQPPFSAVPFDAPADRCTHPGCTRQVSKPGHTLCYDHWKAARAVPPAPPAPPAAAAPPPGQLLTASALAEQLGVPSRRVNLAFAELGWIEKAEDGWRPTERGLALGAVQRVYPKSGLPFVIWPEQIIHHKAVRDALQSAEPAAPTPAADNSFRDRFPARHRTTDGHWVRSRAEVLIDNWLYMSGIVHAYERQLPIEEDAYCDFYVPQGKVYIEYWGLAQDAAYAARCRAKQELYQKYRFNLIELTDEHIRHLDDHLPKLLLRFGVDVT